MRWIDLTPRDFKKMVQETGVCIVPIGSLERHGEHLPFGCDGVIAETIATRAAELEPCVVFPTWYWGQVHEASCFEGTVNFPPEMLITMLRRLLDQIAHNGFKKIILYNGHGGNDAMIRFLDMAMLDERRDYTLYTIGIGSMGETTPEESARIAALMETNIMGHADEEETSMYMACRPGLVKMEYINHEEPLASKERMAHLPGIHSGLWWYAMYPENVGGTPSAATEEKGRVMIDIYVQATARAIARIKADTVVPAMQKEFYDRYDRVGK